MKTVLANFEELLLSPEFVADPYPGLAICVNKRPCIGALLSADGF